MHRFTQVGQQKEMMTEIVELATKCTVSISQLLTLSAMETDKIIEVSETLYNSLLLPGRTDKTSNATIRILDKIEVELAERVEELKPA